MKPVSKAAQKVLDRLFAGMAPESSKTIDNASGTYLALSVERLTETQFSMAHYIQHGEDRVADPDMEFWKGPDGLFYVVAIQQVSGFYTRAVNFKNGKPDTFSPSKQRDLNAFLTLWCKNIVQQQGV